MADNLNEIFEILEIDAEKEDLNLRSYFEELTQKSLYPAQDEAIMLSVISHISTLNKIKYADTLKNVFVRYAKGIWLDLIGEFWDCPRLKASKAVDVLQVKLFDTFESSKILPKGTEIETKDGLYVFVTNDDLIIPAGELTGTVEIESILAGAALNDYKSGDINNLIKPFDYVESVTNINGASAGSDPEENDAYRERILLAPEKLSTAGTEGGYKYYAMSAHKDITDVSVECPQEPATVTIGENIYTETDGNFESEAVSGTVNYKTGELVLSFAEPVSEITVRIQPAATINLNILTKDGEASSGILDKVSECLNSEVRPLSDNVCVYSAEKVVFSVDGTITITPDADYLTVVKAVNKTLEEYYEKIRENFETDVLITDIIKLLKLIDGVYDVKITSPITSLIGDKKHFYYGSTGSLVFERRII